MGMSLSACIRNDNVDEFRAAVEDGAQVSVNNLVASAWLGKTQIFEYISNNFTAVNKKVELLSAVFSQVGNKAISDHTLALRRR